MLYAVLKPIVRAVGRVWLRLSAVGTERVPRDGALLLASNHSSLLDPPLIGCVLPRELDYLAKTELFRIPGFGALIRRLNAHPVDRSGSDSAALRLALRLLGDGRAVLVFPEGTRGAEGRLQAPRTRGPGCWPRSPGRPCSRSTSRARAARSRAGRRAAPGSGDGEVRRTASASRASGAGRGTRRSATRSWRPSAA